MDIEQAKEFLDGETGPDTYAEGVTMHDLTKEGVFQKMTAPLESPTTTEGR